MKGWKSRHCRLGIATTVVLAGGALTDGLVRPAAASGYFLRDQSAIGQGSSFAGSTARADDPSMQFYNPASMVRLPGFQTTIVGTVIDLDSSANSVTGSRAAALGGSVITGTNGGNIGATAFVPATYITAQVAPQWWVGLSVNAPWGLVTKSDVGGVARYYAQTTSLATYNFSPSVAWQVTPTFSLGAALQVQYATAHLSSAVDFGAIGAAAGLGRYGLLPGRADGRATVRGDDVALGWQIGALWEPWQGTRLGVAFRSAVFQELSGNYVQYDNVPALLARAFPQAAGRTKLTTPESVSIGLSQRLSERWTLLADASWTNWSRFRELRVQIDGSPDNVTPERWRDTAFAAIGAEYQATDRLRLRTGFAYDMTPTSTETRTPRIPDNDRYWLSVGASYRITDKLEVSAGYSHIFARDARVSLRAGGPTSPDFLRGNLDAVYRGSVDVFALQLRLAL
ncbi:outer membrane protein transport protein [Roseomonas sp. NAR14]|uniref:Outer membrane protein transport protein n=1 Tax=Roseomonas acroporae TaxID=2937791 RepID=A0A9X1YG97_9PROT|nr:outer membrane protein transport protein [Roseomonas acroporae]MCK8785716.1 outer membrane protein transport protein [Roseomonas acroporae]